MVTPNEFWLAVHTLAEAYDAEGLTGQERLENVLKEFAKLPSIARRQVLADLDRLVASLPEVHTETHVLALEMDLSEPNPRQMSAG